MKKLFFVITTMAIVIVKAQTLVVNSTAKNAEQLIKDILVGQNGNVSISNVKFNNVAVSGTIPNASNQIGSFYVNKPNATTVNPLGIDSGIILTSGGIANAVGPNNASSNSVPQSGPTYNTDPQLLSIASGSVNDAAVLEFDFVPLGTTISFRYRFASEEYNEYVCAGVNDAFGFFISGPGITGIKNVALIPNTTLPVTINSVNLGISGSNGSAATCILACGTNAIWQQNKAYYQNNEIGVASTPPADPALSNMLQYDGLTTILTAQLKNLQCGQTYHIKMAICDISDGAFDSGVLIEGGSFQVTDLVVDNNNNVSDVTGNPFLIYEACVVDTVKFSRDPANTSTQSYGLTYVGSTADTTAGPNGDFVDALGNTIALPLSITFTGANSKTQLIIRTKKDNLVEPNEKLNILVKGQLGSTGCFTGNTPEVLIIIKDQPIVKAKALKDSIYACPNVKPNLVGNITGLLKDVKYRWYIAPGGPSDTVSNQKFLRIKLDSVFPNTSVFSTKDFYFLGKDFCGNKSIDTVTISRLPYDSIQAYVTSPNKDCSKDTVVLKSVFKKGVAPYYAFSFEKIGASGLNIVSNFGDEDTTFTASDTLKIKVYPSATAFYRYTVKDFCRLSKSRVFLDTVKVGDGILPLSGDNLIDSTVICEGKSFDIKINPKGGVKRYRYFWSNGNVKDSAITVSPENTTRYFYKWTDRCAVDTLRDTILVKVSKVKANFTENIPALQAGIQGEQLGNFTPTKFNNLTTNNDTSVSYQWFLNGIALSTDKNFEYTLDYDKDNTVRLVSTNNRGCISIFEKPIAAQTFFKVPNVFTPDNDNVNEKFASINKGVVNYNLQIFNRWGALVYESKEPKEGWNGSINGTKAADGTYFVVLKYNEREGGKENKYQGYVKLVR
jgi:gliding motility-associated-like protein